MTEYSSGLMWLLKVLNLFFRQLDVDCIYQQVRTASHRNVLKNIHVPRMSLRFLRCVVPTIDAVTWFSVNASFPANVTSIDVFGLDAVSRRSSFQAEFSRELQRNTTEQSAGSRGSLATVSEYLRSAQTLKTSRNPNTVHTWLSKASNSDTVSRL